MFDRFYLLPVLLVAVWASFLPKSRAAVTFFYPDTHPGSSITMSVSILTGSSGAQKTVIDMMAIWSDDCLRHRIGISSGMAIGRSSSNEAYNFFFNDASLDYYFRIAQFRFSEQSHFVLRIGAETGMSTLRYGSFELDRLWFVPAVAADFYYGPMFVWAYSGLKYSHLSSVAVAAYAYQYGFDDHVGSLSQEAVESIDGLTLGYMFSDYVGLVVENTYLVSVYSLFGAQIYLTPAMLFAGTYYSIAAGWAYPLNGNAERLLGSRGGFVFSAAWRF